MSLLTWRERNTKGDAIGPTWYLEFDVTPLEEFTRTAEVPIYPVETGSVMADHYQPQPRIITLVGVVSNTPLRPGTAREGMQNSAQLPVGSTRPLALRNPPQQAGPIGIPRPIVTTVLPSRRLIEGNIERARLSMPKFAHVLQFNDDVTRTTDVFQVIDGLMETRTPVNVLILDELEFTDMMITNHRVPRIAGSGGSLEFTVDLIQIKSAESQFTKPKAEVPKDTKHKPKKDSGKRNPKPVEPATTETSRIMGATWAAQANPNNFPVFPQ
jgi:hypothetical protein